MIFRVEKTKDFTVMSNYHLKDKNLTLKAKGLLSWILSLPEDWNYSLAGIVSCCKEGEASVKAALKELQKYGYIEVVKHNADTVNSRIHYDYNVYEYPKSLEGGFLGLENLPVENLAIENHRQINTNIKNTNIKNKKEINTKSTHARELVSSKDYVKEIFDYYQTNCKDLTGIKIITDDRKQAVKKILEKYGPDTVKEVLDKAQASRFLRGEGSQGWKCNFDWIFKPTNFRKILEGNYDGTFTSRKKKDVFSEGNGKVKSTPIDREKKKKYVEELRKNGEQVEY